MNEVDGAKADSDTAKEFVFATEYVVKDVSLSQSGCEVLFRNQTYQFFSEVPTEG